MIARPKVACRAQIAEMPARKTGASRANVRRSRCREIALCGFHQNRSVCQPVIAGEGRSGSSLT